MTDTDQAAPTEHPDPTFIVKPFLASQGGEYCIGIAVDDPMKQVLLWHHPEGHWVRKDEVEFTEPDPNGGILRYWALDAIQQLESGVSGSTWNVDTPYRDWFHKNENDAVCALGLRLALGMKVHDEIEDIAMALVNARLDDAFSDQLAYVNDPEAGIGGVVFILAKDGRFLMEERDDIGDHGKTWFFPAGKREVGETCLATLAREMDEELSVFAEEIEVMTLVDRPGGPANPYKMQPFLIQTWDSKDHPRGWLPGATDNGNRLRWIGCDLACSSPVPAIAAMAKEAKTMLGWV